MKTKIIFSTLASVLIIAAADVHAQSTLASNNATGTAPNPTQYLGFSNAYDIPFKTGNVERMRIIHSSGNAAMPNGNINIGPLINTTYTAISKVTINPALTANLTPDGLIGLAVAKQVTNGYSRALLFVPHLGGGYYNSMSQNGDVGIIWTDGGNGVVGSGNQNATGGFVIAPHSGSAGLRITSGGNVGIGTPLINNPNNYKLAVNGTIGARAIKVEISTNTWPDYVFDKKYTLMPLADLEKFIRTNNHLPNIPPAAEIEKEGVDLGAINVKLLEKIEELSLYIIEQNKRIDEQNKRLEALENR